MYRIIYLPEMRIMKESWDKGIISKYYANIYKDYKEDYVVVTAQQYKEMQWEF